MMKPGAEVAQLSPSALGWRLRHGGAARDFPSALRLLADHFGVPVITLVDTSGAYPGIDAEARGQAEAVATSIDTCLSLGVPMVSVVIGEGGSGGALAIAVGTHSYIVRHPGKDPPIRRG